MICQTLRAQRILRMEFGTNILHLDDKLKNMISNISLKFTFKEKLYINFMDLFPRLKDGKCIARTLHYIIYIFYIYIDKYQIENNIFPEDLGIPFLTPKEYSQDNVINFINSHIVYIDSDNIDEQIYKEFALSEDLRIIFQELFFRPDNIRLINNRLLYIFRFIYGYKSKKLLHTELLHTELLKDDYISLLFNIANQNTTEIYTALIFEEINPSYNELYQFALDSYGDNNINVGILNVVKNSIVRRNWLEKEAIMIMFGELSNDIFQHIIKFR